MGTLLLRLAAPLQAWGAEANFDIRKTYREPSKSGVVGLLAAALGRDRRAAIDDLNALRFGVRVDQEGRLLKDFHIAHTGKKNPCVTTRYYLADAVFLAGLESEDEAFLLHLDAALRRPYFPLFLGRRSCPPAGQLALGIRELPLEAALRAEPWQAAAWRQPKLDPSLRIIMDRETSDGLPARQKDLARSFDPEYRQYGFRLVEELRRENKGAATTVHDPLTELK